MNKKKQAASLAAAVAIGAAGGHLATPTTMTPESLATEFHRQITDKALRTELATELLKLKLPTEYQSIIEPTPPPPTSLGETEPSANCNWKATIKGDQLLAHLRSQQALDLVWCDEPPRGFTSQGVPHQFKRNGEMIGANLKSIPGYVP